MRTLNLGRDNRDVPVPAIPYADGDVAVLVADTEQQWTIPAGARFVYLSAEGDFWCKVNQSATAITVPSASVTDQTGPMLNPVMLALNKNATTLHLIAGADTNVSISWYTG